MAMGGPMSADFPRTVADAHAEAQRFVVGERLDVLEPDGDRLRLLADDPHVGVVGAPAAGGVQGAQGEITHGGLLPSRSSATLAKRFSLHHSCVDAGVN